MDAFCIHAIFCDCEISEIQEREKVDRDGQYHRGHDPGETQEVTEDHQL